MPALLGLLLGAIVGHWLWPDWGAALGGLLGFFGGAIWAAQRERHAFRKPQAPPTTPLARSAEERIAILEARVAALEAQLQSLPSGRAAAATLEPRTSVALEGDAGTEVVTGSAQVASVTTTASEAQSEATPLPRPSASVSEPAEMAVPTTATVAPAASAARAPALVARLWAWFTGGNAMTRIGVVVLFFGVAFLLRYFAEHFTVPLTWRLAGVAFAGAVLVVLGRRIARSRAAYGWALQGAGTGILYLTTFAAFRQFDLLPAPVALVLLALIAALTIALALSAEAEPLAALALAGAFLAPVLTDRDVSPVPLFAYFAVVNGVVVVIAASRAWRSIALLGFVFTFALGLYWGDRFYRPSHFASVEPFLILFVAAYVAIAIVQARRAETAATSRLLGVLVFGVPIVAFAIQTELVRDTRYGAAASALVAGLAYAALARAVRQGPGASAALARYFLAIAVVFVTIAVPFAFDHRVTAALWSIEGALVYWLGLEQRSRAIRLFAIAVQLGAGVLFADFASSASLRADALLFLNRYFFGAIMVAVAGIASAWCADRRADALAGWERAAAPLLFAWGALWWLGAGALEVMRWLPTPKEPHAALGWVVGTTVLVLLVEARWKWTRLLGLALALPVAMAFIGLADLERVHTTLRHAGWIVWPIAWIVLFSVLRRLDRADAIDAPGTRALRRTAEPAHAFAAFALVVHVGWELSEWVGKITADDTVWVACAAALPAIGYLALAVSPTVTTRWPFAAQPRAYRRFAATPLALLLAVWVVLVNLLSPGEPYPLRYLPLLNPLDVTLALALWLLLRWAGEVLGLEERRRYALLGIGIFVTVNGELLRTAHHWGDIPWDLHALLASRPLQAAITLAWSVTGAALMVVAGKRRLRPLWMVGAALLAVVVVKLFVLDLGGLSGLPRVVAFLGVGALLLLIGYIAPLPPERSREKPPTGPDRDVADSPTSTR